MPLLRPNLADILAVFQHLVARMFTFFVMANPAAAPAHKGD